MILLVNSNVYYNTWPSIGIIHFPSKTLYVGSLISHIKLNKFSFSKIKMRSLTNRLQGSCYLVRLYYINYDLSIDLSQESFATSFQLFFGCKCICQIVFKCSLHSCKNMKSDALLNVGVLCII